MSSTAPAAQKKSWKIPASAVAGLIALLIIGGLFYRSRRANALTEKDTVVLADFVNTTGDAVFDGTLKQALAVQLERSPYINLLPESRMREALRFMGRPPGERITSDVAREISLREGAKAVLAGSIASLGSSYVITLTAVNAQTGDSLAREQVEAASKEQVLKALDTGASSLRGKLGESLGSVQKFATPLEQATTSSLEALQAYSLGQGEHLKLNDEKAAPHLKRAIELDPNFAMAYGTLGVAYSNNSAKKPAREAIQKAFDLRERASEREKLYISAHYYDIATGEIEKTVEIYEQWKQFYPRDTLPLDNLALVYNSIGQQDKAVVNATQSLQIDAKDRYAYQNLAAAYMHLGRYEEARAIVEQAETQKAGSFGVHAIGYLLGFIRGDQTAMQRVRDTVAGTSDESSLIALTANSRYFQGRVREGRKMGDIAAQKLEEQQSKEEAALSRAAVGSFETEIGNPDEGRRQTLLALSMTNEKDIRSLAARTLVRTGDSGRAEKIIADLSREYPSDTLLNKVALAVARAAIELQRKQPARAMEILEATRPFELGGGPDGPHYWPIYLRAEAYLDLHDTAKALAEYQTITDHRGLNAANPLYVLARLGAGRAYTLAGDPAKARAAYQDFFGLWKDADPDVPILEKAKAEYEKVQ